MKPLPNLEKHKHFGSKIGFWILPQLKRGSSKITGVFPVIWRIELILREINGVFPVMHNKILYFHVFRFNRRNLSVY